MGQKVHPIGLRLGIHRKWKTIWFADSFNYTKFLHLNFRIENFLKGYFNYSFKKSILIDCKILKYSWEKIFIFIFFYRYRFFIEKRLRKLLRLKKDLIGKKLKSNFKVFSYNVDENKRNLNFNIFTQKNLNLHGNIHKIPNNIVFWKNSSWFYGLKYFSHNLDIRKLYLKQYYLTVLKLLNNNILSVYTNWNQKIINNLNNFAKQNLIEIKASLNNKLNNKIYLNIIKNSYLINIKSIFENFNKIILEDLIINLIKNIKKVIYINFLIFLKKNRLSFTEKPFEFYSKILWNKYVTKIDFEFIYSLIWSKIYLLINCMSLLYFYFLSFELKQTLIWIKKNISNCLIQSNNFSQVSLKKTIQKHKIKKMISTLFLNSKKHLNFTFFNKTAKITKNSIKDFNIVDRKTYGSFYDVKKALRILTKSQVNIFFINSLSLIRFQARLQNNRNDVALSKDWKIKKKYLAFIRLQDKFSKKYKYISILTKDLVNICFITMLLKRPVILARFLGLQVKQLPFNRNQLRFLRFAMRTVLSFASGRSEILGIRLKIKGRFNKWRRTKFIMISKGKIPLQTYKARVEYGFSKGFVKKGAFGVHIWIYYDKNFKDILKNIFNQYFEYSRQKNHIENLSLKC